MDIVRVIRIIEYTGPRDFVENQIANSLHGTHEFPRTSGPKVTIRVATLGGYPEILGQLEEKK